MFTLRLRLARSQLLYISMPRHNFVSILKKWFLFFFSGTGTGTGTDPGFVARSIKIRRKGVRE